MMNERARIVSSMTFLALLACSGSDAAGSGAAEEPAEHACEARAESGTPLLAAEEESDAPLLAVSEEPYAVALPEAGPGFAGWLALEGPLDALLFAGAAAAVTELVDDAGDDVLPAPAPNESCPSEIPEHFDLALEGTGEYRLRLGPIAEPSLWLQLGSAEGHAH